MIPLTVLGSGTGLGSTPAGWQPAGPDPLQPIAVPVTCRSEPDQRTFAQGDVCGEDSAPGPATLGQYTELVTSGLCDLDFGRYLWIHQRCATVRRPRRPRPLAFPSTDRCPANRVPIGD